MIRLAAALVLWAFGSTAALAAAAGGELYAISGVAVDATAESATAARDSALAEGRPVAWQRLFRRLTPQTEWAKQPQLDDMALQRMILSFRVANERRSTTRYLADVTYQFNPTEVGRVMRQAGVAFAETQGRPVLLIPVMGGKFDLNTPWGRAWANPSVSQGLVPITLPRGDVDDIRVLSQPDLTQLDWAALEPLATKYGVAQVVIALATPEGNATQLIMVNAQGKQTESLAFARGTFVTTADAAAMKIAEVWKDRSAVDYGQRGRLAVDVDFRSLEEWARIRNQLAAIRSVSEVALIGMSLNEARVEFTFFGRPEQLRDIFQQQSLDFRAVGRAWRLQLAGAAPATAVP
jgi:hypothetical protein